MKKYHVNFRLAPVPVLTIVLLVVQYELKVIHDPVVLNLLDVAAIIINAITPLLRENKHESIGTASPRLVSKRRP